MNIKSNIHTHTDILYIRKFTCVYPFCGGLFDVCVWGKIKNKYFAFKKTVILKRCDGYLVVGIWFNEKQHRKKHADEPTVLDVCKQLKVADGSPNKWTRASAFSVGTMCYEWCAFSTPKTKRSALRFSVRRLVWFRMFGWLLWVVSGATTSKQKAIIIMIIGKQRTLLIFIWYVEDVVVVANAPPMLGLRHTDWCE